MTIVASQPQMVRLMLLRTVDTTPAMGSRRPRSQPSVASLDAAAPEAALDAAEDIDKDDESDE